MEKIIECIPNFSEGQDQKIITAIAESIKSVPETQLLHQTSDPDHNRTVLTFIGPPEAVIESAFRSTEKASKLIDLTKHQGVHPRIGATDVLPWVPLKGVSEEKCIELAKKLGQRIGTELQIPVHLYDKTARSKERQNLAFIRKKGYKDLPDFGPKKPGNAGSTALGVRDILIAFNVNLKTSDLSVTKAIAKKIRESSGGFPFLKALGLELKSRNITQVSMNFTNYKITGIKKVFDTISKEAKNHNIEILESELIGMIPDDALFKNFQEYLKLPHLPENQILHLQNQQNSV